jgi:bifunctional DNA-binding transcriptional regulator/antitoxin component of YhaV-PrlF toxin-antitoxin module
MSEVKHRRRGATTISSKHQVTIPLDAMRASGLEAGERVVARAEGPGRVVLEREDDRVAQYAGVLTGVFAPDELENLRREWD